MFGLLFVLWWIVEFLNFAGRIGIDPFDITGVAILAAGGWLCPASMAGAVSPLRQQIFHQFRPDSGFIFLQSARTADRAFMKWITCRADPLRQRSHFRVLIAAIKGGDGANCGALGCASERCARSPRS
jgi:hypothetical protein